PPQPSALTAQDAREGANRCLGLQHLTRGGGIMPKGWQDSRMDVSVHSFEEGGRTVVQVGGEIDVYTAPVLRERLAALHEKGRHELVIDLRAVRFMDSTGLGVLVGVLKRVRLAGGSLALVIDSERVLKVFHITALTQIFEIHPSLPHALAAAPTPPPDEPPTA